MKVREFSVNTRNFHKFKFKDFFYYGYIQVFHLSVFHDSLNQLQFFELAYCLLYFSSCGAYFT